MTSFNVPAHQSLEQLIAENSPHRNITPDADATFNDPAQAEYYQTLAPVPPPEFPATRVASVPGLDDKEIPSGTRKVSALEYTRQRTAPRESSSSKGGRLLLSVLVAGGIGGALAVWHDNRGSSPNLRTTPQVAAKNFGSRPATHHKARTAAVNHLLTNNSTENSTKESPVKPVSAAEKRRIEEIARRAMAASRGHHLKGETAIKGVPAEVLHTGGAPVEPKPNAKATSTKPQPGGAPASGKKTAHTASRAAAPQVRYTYPHIWEACQANGEWQVYEQDTSTSPIISYPYMPQAGTCQQGAH